MSNLINHPQYWGDKAQQKREMAEPIQNDPMITTIADEIVATYCRPCAFDDDSDEPYAALWRKYRAQGVSRETFQAAKAAARPRTLGLYLDYIKRITDAAPKGLQLEDDDQLH